MKLFLTAAAVAVLLSTGAYAQNTQPDESKAAPSGQTKATAQEKPAGAGMSSGAANAPAGGAMKTQTTGSGDQKAKDDAGSKDNVGDKTGVSGGKQ